MFYKFMLITHLGTSIDAYKDFIKKCLDGGITSLQLREKSLGFDELTALGGELIKILEPYKAPLIINDSAELAEKLNQNHIHLGQSDDSIQKALLTLKNPQIGISIESTEQILKANEEPLAYATASAVFPTSNKSNITKIWGLEGLKSLAKISKHPLTAIGGITLQNCESVLQNGAKGIALIGAIHDSDDPYKACKGFRDILDRNP